MRLLQRNFDVDTRYGGGFVQSIDGIAGGREAAAPVDWFYYVNGIEAPRAPRRRKLRAGDRVWWDRHDWGADAARPGGRRLVPRAVRARADGKRLPVRIECAETRAPRAARSQARLADAGVKVGTSALGHARRDGDAARRSSGRGRACARDPRAAARSSRARRERRLRAPRADGTALAVLDAAGRTVRTLGAGGGLVAATRLATSQPPTWVVTGTDDGGRARRRRARCARARSRDRFALAVEDGRPVALPVGPEGRRRDLPPPRAARCTPRAPRPACAYCAGAGRARARRSSTRSCWSRRSLRGRRGRRCAAGVGARAARGRALVALPFALLIALHQPARRARRADRVARAGRACRRSGRSTSRSRRSSTARCSALRASWSCSRLRAVLRRPSIPTRCCALFRRVSFRSALTAALATRMVPVLARDARRMADAQRCRAGRAGARGSRSCARSPPGALDRAVDVAATLEVRGYGAARRAAARRAPAVVAARPRLRRLGGRRSSRSSSARASAASASFERLPARSTRRRPGRRRCSPCALVARRAAAVRRPQGDRRDERRCASSGVTLPLSRTRPAPALRDVSLAVERGRVRACSRACRARASRRCCAPPAASCRTSTAASSAGASTSAGSTRASTGPARARRGRRDAAPGPRDAGRDGHRARRARLPAREPRLGAGRGRARGGGGGARARHRRAARPPDARALGRRAPARRARRGARRPAARWCCSTSRPRSSTRSPATS